MIAVYPTLCGKAPRHVNQLSGCNAGEATPVSITNIEINPSSAAGAAPVIMWESKSPPEAPLLCRICLISYQVSPGERLVNRRNRRYSEELT
jgi:hypothetical protein